MRSLTKPEGHKEPQPMTTPKPNQNHGQEANQPNKFNRLSLQEQEIFIERLGSNSREIIDLIGFDKTIALFAAFGGADFVIPKNKAACGAEKFKELSNVIGKNSVLRLSRHFGDGKVYFPVCRDSFIAVRNHRIISMFDDLSRSMSANRAVERLRRVFCLTCRQIEDIINKPS
jgi:hypothetical protein